MTNAIDAASELDANIERVKDEAVHALAFLRETATLSASLTFFVTHRLDGGDTLVSVRFPPPWSTKRDAVVSLSKLSETEGSILSEPRVDADTVIHAHTPYLSAWSLAHEPFPILYVAAQRNLAAREIPVHLERRRSVLDVIRERLDRYPDLAPPPALLESNGGANFWGRGIVETAKHILLIEEAARFQALAAAIGGAKHYTPGALELQWARTGLLEKATSFGRAFAE